MHESGYEIILKTIIISEQHNWTFMVSAISDYIKSLNWGYRVALRDAGVTYLNEYGEFVNKNTLKVSVVY